MDGGQRKQWDELHSVLQLAVKASKSDDRRDRNVRWITIRLQDKKMLNQLNVIESEMTSEKRTFETDWAKLRINCGVRVCWGWYVRERQSAVWLV